MIASNQLPVETSLMKQIYVSAGWTSWPETKPFKISEWDLIVCDEAHKMSATVWGGEVKYTKRFQLGRLLSNITRNYLLLTATPHNGKEDDFHLFLSLVDPDRFEGTHGNTQQAVDVSDVSIEIIEARITHLAYAPEIAAVMLQRQQASAIIDARKMIVDGAVGMVEMALERLNENNTVVLDEERKAAMVSNLLVVLCGNHDAQPVVNSGSLY